MAYFPGVGGTVIWLGEEGILNTNFPKIQMPGGLSGGGGDVEASISLVHHYLAIHVTT